ncbi:MAG: hypothetical protein D3911_02080 [Candidatus Electrothrix sp. AW3_4]|nr:hypothetical protein [Candidatus Electrothrix gigas]
MRKIVCVPKNLIPQHLKTDTKYFCTYSNPRRDDVGYFGPDLIEQVMRRGLKPSVQVWDFMTIALSVTATDNSVTREKSADGWTRQIELHIHLCDPTIWEPVKIDLQDTLRFLTGDFWKLKLLGGGVRPPSFTPIDLFPTYEPDCIALLSGGADSLAGALDLISEPRRPMFVSQVVKGDTVTQKKYAQQIQPGIKHCQWSHKIHRTKGESEQTTRARSLIFFAFAALAASAMTPSVNRPVEIFVPENGFISLNIPLHTGRIGSLSTKTTHPVYLAGIQKIWDALDFNLKLVSPYRFKTKGEILKECGNQELLKELIAESTSCGKYQRKWRHCGRCVPCMVRRAAFKYAGIPDSTITGYKFEKLSHVERPLKGPDDVGAMAIACLKYRQYGIRSLIGGSLSFASTDKRKEFEGVIKRGLEEIEGILIENKVI